MTTLVEVLIQIARRHWRRMQNITMWHVTQKLLTYHWHHWNDVMIKFNLSLKLVPGALFFDEFWVFERATTKKTIYNINWTHTTAETVLTSTLCICTVLHRLTIVKSDASRINYPVFLNEVAYEWMNRINLPESAHNHPNMLQIVGIESYPSNITRTKDHKLLEKKSR